MAILIDSAKGKGFTACVAGKPQTDNPYLGIESICDWYEWLSGWQQAYDMNKFGIKG